MTKQKSPRQLVYEKALIWARKNLEKIDVLPGEYHGNQKCHEVARQYLQDGNLVIALSFVPKSGVNIHFLNKRPWGYIDNTLGYLSAYNTYFKIAEFGLN